MPGEAHRSSGDAAGEETRTRAGESFREMTPKPRGRPRGKESICGTVQSYWRGCRCRACKDEQANYQRNLYRLREKLRKAKAPAPAPLNRVDRMMALARA